MNPSNASSKCCMQRSKRPHKHRFHGMWRRFMKFLRAMLARSFRFIFQNVSCPSFNYLIEGVPGAYSHWVRRLDLPQCYFISWCHRSPCSWWQTWVICLGLHHISWFVLPRVPFSFQIWMQPQEEPFRWISGRRTGSVPSRVQNQQKGSKICHFR